MNAMVGISGYLIADVRAAYDRSLQYVLTKKGAVLPQLLLGVSFRSGQQPIQDFVTLLKVRNDVVHYKMKPQNPRYLADLAQRGIALAVKGKGIDCPWPWTLSCTEGVRWAHNTACRTAKGLTALLPDDHRSLLSLHAENYDEITDQFVHDWFTAHRRSQGTADQPISD